MLVQTKSCTVAARRELTREETGGGYLQQPLPSPAPAACPHHGGTAPASPMALPTASPHATLRAAAALHRCRGSIADPSSQMIHTRSSTTSYLTRVPSINCNHTSSPNAPNIFHFHPSSC